MLKDSVNDIDVAEMLTQYVEDLENKTASLEEKLLLQQKELRQKKLKLEQKERLLLEIQRCRNKNFLSLAEARKQHSDLNAEKYMLRTSLKEELIVSTRLHQQIQKLRRRWKKISTLKSTFCDKCTYNLPNENGMHPGGDLIRYDLHSRKHNLSILFNQKEKDIRSIREKREGIQHVKLKLTEVGSSGKHCQAPHFEIEIAALTNSIREWKTSCNNTIKKIREKRTS